MFDLFRFWAHLFITSPTKNNSLSLSFFSFFFFFDKHKSWFAVELFLKINSSTKIILKQVQNLPNILSDLETLHFKFLKIHFFEKKILVSYILSIMQAVFGIVVYSLMTIKYATWPLNWWFTLFISFFYFSILHGP